MSYLDSHTTRSMVLKWKDTPVTLNPSIKLLDFTLPQITQTDCTQKGPYGGKYQVQPYWNVNSDNVTQFLY